MEVQDKIKGLQNLNLRRDGVHCTLYTVHCTVPEEPAELMS